MIIVFTGNGKGKTTASLGQAVRSVGRGKNVLMIQFIKGPWKSGEDFIDIKPKGSPSTGSISSPQASSGLPAFELVKMGLGFVGIQGDALPREKHREAAEKALGYFREELPKRDVIILDEINVATSIGLLSENKVLTALREVPLEKFVILTGRGAPQSFIDLADLVTEMKEIKHPFNDGKFAKIALDF